MIFAPSGKEILLQDVKKVAGHSSGNCFHQERHPKGTLLLRQGAAEERVIFVIISGSIQLLRQQHGREDRAVDVLATLETGQLFGTFGPELKMPFSAKVVSKNCEVLSARASHGQRWCFLLLPGRSFNDSCFFISFFEIKKKKPNHVRSSWPLYSENCGFFQLPTWQERYRVVARVGGGTDHGADVTGHRGALAEELCLQRWWFSVKSTSIFEKVLNWMFTNDVTITTKYIYLKKKKKKKKHNNIYNTCWGRGPANRFSWYVFAVLVMCLSNCRCHLGFPFPARHGLAAPAATDRKTPPAVLASLRGRRDVRAVGHELARSQEGLAAQKVW